MLRRQVQRPQPRAQPPPLAEEAPGGEGGSQALAPCPPVPTGGLVLVPPSALAPIPTKASAECFTETLFSLYIHTHGFVLSF